jgi:4'-phosphopantetheinyl transferase
LVDLDGFNNELSMHYDACQRSEAPLCAHALSDPGSSMAPATDPKFGIMAPVLVNDDVEVVAFLLNREPDIIRELGFCLSEDERRRAGRLRLERDRSRFIATRGQLRLLLASKLAIPPPEVELEYGPQGKPHLSRRMPGQDLRFSVTRSGNVSAIALSNTREVGIDIEEVVPVPEADDIAALCFSTSEYGSYVALRPEDRLKGFLRRWTHLEAIAKALGCGLGHSIRLEERDWTAHTFLPNPGYIGTVVVRN